MIEKLISGGLSNILGGFINEFFQNRTADKNLNRYLKVMDIQNAYNSPAAQVERLKQAGLSPGLMFGGSNPGGISTNPSTPNQQASLLDVATQGANIKLLNEQANLLKAQAELVNKEMDKTEAETSNLISLNQGINLDNVNKSIQNRLSNLDADLKELQLEIATETKAANIEHAIQQLAQLNKEIDFLTTRNDIAERTKEEIINNATLVNSKLLTEISLNRIKEKATDAEIDNIRALTSKYFSEILYTSSKRLIDWENLKLSEREIEAKLKDIAIKEGFYNNLIKQGYWKMVVDGVFSTTSLFMK